MTVILIGFHRKAVSAQSERVTADAESLGEAQEFDFLRFSDGRFALRTLEGKFIRAWPSGKLDAEPSVAKDWELFRLIERGGGRVAIVTHHDLHFSAQPTGELVADRVEISDWEEFYLHIAAGSDQLFGGSETEGAALGTSELFDRYVAHPEEGEKAILTLLRTPASVPPKADTP